VTKDKEYLVINNSTKEDSEIWVLDRSGQDKKPLKIFSRKAGIRYYIDHLRDFFMVITNNNVRSKNFKLYTLNDSMLKGRKNDEEMCDCSNWKDLKLTEEEEGLNV